MFPYFTSVGDLKCGIYNRTLDICNFIFFSFVFCVGEKPQLYKRLLNEYAQKLWKQPPVYQTRNEGSGHEPRFRSTVWADGVSYTSPDTFKQRKTAEADATRIALFATMHKLKNEALRLVHEVWHVH